MDLWATGPEQQSILSYPNHQSNESKHWSSSISGTQQSYWLPLESLISSRNTQCFQEATNMSNSCSNSTDLSQFRTSCWSIYWPREYCLCRKRLSHCCDNYADPQSHLLWFCLLAHWASASHQISLSLNCLSSITSCSMYVRFPSAYLRRLWIADCSSACIGSTSKLMCPFLCGSK